MFAAVVNNKPPFGNFSENGVQNSPETIGSGNEYIQYTI